MTTLPLTSDHLSELEQLALACPLDFSHLTYREIQQSLVLYSVLEFFASHGIQLPFSLESLHEPVPPGAANSDD